MAGALEDPVHAAIVAWIKAVAPSCVVVHVPNELQRHKLTRFKQAKLGARTGAADLIVFAPWKVLCIEVKREVGGVLSKAQKAFRDDVRGLGHHWAVCRSIDDARNAFAAAQIETKEAR